jgi:hypothetical protein
MIISNLTTILKDISQFEKYQKNTRISQSISQYKYKSPLRTSSLTYPYVAIQPKKSRKLRVECDSAINLFLQLIMLWLKINYKLYIKKMSRDVEKC